MFNFKRYINSSLLVANAITTVYPIFEWLKPGSHERHKHKQRKQRMNSPLRLAKTKQREFFFVSPFVLLFAYAWTMILSLCLWLDSWFLCFAFCFALMFMLMLSCKPGLSRVLTCPKNRKNRGFFLWILEEQSVKLPMKYFVLPKFKRKDPRFLRQVRTRL